MRYLRAIAQPLADLEADDPSKPVRWVASTEGLKSDGENLQADQWALDRYERYGPVLWGHDFAGSRLPIGTGKAWIENRQLLIDVTYDTEDPFAMQVRRKARGGMAAGSVSWDKAIIGGEPRNILLEFSNVPVGLDENSLPLRARARLTELQREMDELLTTEPEAEPDAQPAPEPHARGAIPPHTTPKAPEDAPWDGPAQVAACPAEAAPLRRMHAWVDSSMDPNTKQAYKLPHHDANGEVVWRGVAAAMARLLQGGTQIPDADRRGVFNHLQRHYVQFDKTAPEFRTADELAALTPDLIRGLFAYGECDMEVQERTGAVLSARNLEDLQQAVTLIQAVLDRAKKDTTDEAGRAADEADGTRAAPTPADIKKLMGMMQSMMSLMQGMMGDGGAASKDDEDGGRTAEEDSGRATLDSILARLQVMTQ